MIGVDQIRSCVLLNKNEIIKISEILNDFLDHAEGKQTGGDVSVGEVIRQHVNRILGEGNAANSIQSAFDIQWAIPFQTDLLNISYEDLTSGKRLFPPKKLHKLRAIQFHLNDVLANIDRVWTVTQNKKGEWQETAGPPSPGKPAQFSARRGSTESGLVLDSPKRDSLTGFPFKYCAP